MKDLGSRMSAMLHLGPPTAEDRWVLSRAMLCYLLLWSGIWLSGYRFLDDRGRVLWGNLGWEQNGRPLTTWLMRIFTREGHLVDVTPLPQLLAIVVMAIALVVLRRQLKAPARWGWLLCALPLFATPLYMENMAFRFDALSMTLAVLAGLIAASALWSYRSIFGVLVAAVVLWITLMLYQPAINVYLAFCCLFGALEARDGGMMRLGRDASRALAALAVALVLYWPVMQHFLPDAGYSAEHAERFDLWALPAGSWENLMAAWRRVFGWLPQMTLWPLLALLGLGAVTMLRCGAVWRRGIPALACLILSPLALFGLMLALVDPIWEPRTFVGLGGVVVCWTMLAWHAGYDGAWRRLAGILSTIYLVGVLVQAWLFGGMLSELRQHERTVLGDIAQQVNEQYLVNGRDRLVIEGSWGWPPIVERSRQRDPLMQTLLPRGLSEGNYWNEPALDLHGLYESVVVSSPSESQPAEPVSIVQESRYYRLWWDGSQLILTLQG